MSEAAVVGIDGGGSKTIVAAADRTGRVFELRRGGPVSPLESRHWAAELTRQAAPFSDVSGLAGVVAALPAHGEVDHISAAQRQAVAGVFGAVPQQVLNDVDAANIGAFGGGPGILILAGTGSMAWARDAQGNSHRTGGWGEIIGDEGSGYWIGRRVLAAVSQSIDGRLRPTTLVESTFTFLGLDLADPANSLEGWVVSVPNQRAGIASLARVATEQAETGDPVAGDIVQSAAEELARHLQAMERRLGDDGMRWSYAGGVFGSRAMLRAVTEQVGRPPQLPKLPPIGGALLAAAQQLDWQVDDEWIARLAQSLDAAPAGTDDGTSPQQETGNA